MDNLITLYKVGFSYGGVKQPYFTTSEARDTYFSKCPSLQVNKEGVNINVGKEYIIDFKANVDVTIAQQYNFAIIRYNGKDYYCAIIDCEHISVNKSRVFTKRNPMFEIVNPFQYFERFNVNEMSRPWFSYHANSTRILPSSMRTYSNKLDIYEDNIWDNTSVNPHKKLRYRHYNIDGSGYLDTPNWLYIPFLSVFVKSNEVNFATVDLYDQYSQSFCYLIPLNEDSLTYQYLNTSSDIVTIAGAIQATHNKVITTLNNISANIASMQMIYLPCRVGQPSTETNHYVVMPFVINDYITVSDAVGYFRMASPRFITSKKLDTLSFIYDEAINEGVNANWQRIFHSMDIQFFSRNLTQHIDFADYSSYENLKVGFEVEAEYIVSDTGWSLRCTIKALYGDSKINNTYEKVSIFPFIDKTSYNVTAEARFEAENAYYNELTNSYRNQKIIGHAVQAGENLAVGSGQWLQGSSVLGQANLIRGVFEGSDMWVDDHFIEQQRELNALNEKAKPAEYFAASNSQSFWREQNNEIWIFENVLNSADFNAYKQHLRYYGEPVVIVTDSITPSFLRTNATDEFIYLKFVATVKDNGIFQARDYSELYKYFSEGHCYQIF